MSLSTLATSQVTLSFTLSTYMYIADLTTSITSLTTSKTNITITGNSFDPKFFSLSLYILVSSLVTYSSTMSTSSSTTYLSVTTQTTSTTSSTSLLLILSSAQPPAPTVHSTLLRCSWWPSWCPSWWPRQPPWAPPTPPVWCPGPSGLCLGYINAKTIGKNPFWIILISCNIFSQWSHAFQIGPTWPYYNFYCVWCFFSGLESLSLYQMSSLDNRWRLRQVKPIGLHQLVVDWSILLLWLLAKAGEKNSTDHFYQFG